MKSQGPQEVSTWKHQPKGERRWEAQIPGFEVAEIAPWREGDETWRGLRAKFPPSIASHSTEQDFYFGEDFLLRCHDYYLDIAGGVAAAHYVYDVVEGGWAAPS